MFLTGNETTKKSIGQTTFINKKYKFFFSLSEFKWSVMNENADDLQNYLNNDNKNDIIFKIKDDYIKQILNL